MRSWGRPTRPMVGLVAAGVVLFVAGAFLIHGTPPTHAHLVGGHGRVQVDRTGARDYVRLALAVGGIALFLFGTLRWSTQRERSPQESDARHGYGDSIVDARTSVDPVVGMRPVGSEPPRR